jgi:hypothetical protein
VSIIAQRIAAEISHAVQWGAKLMRNTFITGKKSAPVLHHWWKNVLRDEKTFGFVRKNHPSLEYGRQYNDPCEYVKLCRNATVIALPIARKYDNS